MREVNVRGAADMLCCLFYHSFRSYLASICFPLVIFSRLVSQGWVWKKFHFLETTWTDLAIRCTHAPATYLLCSNLQDMFSSVTIIEIAIFVLLQLKHIAVFSFFKNFTGKIFNIKVKEHIFIWLCLQKLTNI